MKLLMIVEPCETLEDACRNAQEVANDCRWEVGFDFNSVRCIAKPGGDPELLAHRQQEASRAIPTVHSGEDR